MVAYQPVNTTILQMGIFQSAFSEQPMHTKHGVAQSHGAGMSVDHIGNEFLHEFILVLPRLGSARLRLDFGRLRLSLRGRMLRAEADSCSFGSTPA